VDRRFFLLGAPLALGACAAEPVWAPDDLVQRNIYRHPGPNMLTLFTVLNVGSDNGAHSGLMVSGSQRVIFDPAGTFKHPTIPERNDVIFGATPGLVDLYIDYHTRETYYTVEQRKEVSPEVAQMALSAVQSYGAVSKAQCSKSISEILRGLPGFETVRNTWFPDNLRASFAALSDVQTFEYRDSDSDNNAGVLLRLDTAQ
jgi:hypothetical protein